MIVVDASLAAKWILNEADSPAALNFLFKHGRDLSGPELIFIEVASAIVRRGNEGTVDRKDALRALDKWTIAWSDHVIKRFETTQRRLFNASALALELGHPLKDCIYLGLAVELDCELATCDAKFAEKAVVRHPAVRLLSDYASAT
jgi:predicted nucleic acid-binding protein